MLAPVKAEGGVVSWCTGCLNFFVLLLPFSVGLFSSYLFFPFSDCC